MKALFMNILVTLAGWAGSFLRWASKSSTLASVGQITGISLVTFGVFEVFPPAAWIFLGAAVLFLSLGLE